MALLVFNGCDPTARRNVDEERDPHFLEGQNALARLDWEEAIRRFESALESNPNSGVAHRELGLLFDDKKTNYLRALYHYDRYRDLRPAAKDPVVDDHVYSCQVNLAQKLPFIWTETKPEVKPKSCELISR